MTLPDFRKKESFTPLEKAADFNRRLLPLKADGDSKLPSARTVRKQNSLMGFICAVNLFFIFAASSFFIMPASAADARESAVVGYTLLDCYKFALKQSETIAIQKERILEAEGHFLQSLSGVLPHASFAYSEKWQDGSNDSSFTLKEVPEGKFVFSQPLFSGFKEFAAMAGAKAEQRQFHQETIRAEQLLFV